MCEQNLPVMKSDMTADEIQGLKHINLHLFRRGLPQVKSTAEFRLQHLSGQAASSTLAEASTPRGLLQAPPHLPPPVFSRWEEGLPRRS